MKRKSIKISVILCLGLALTAINYYMLVVIPRNTPPHAINYSNTHDYSYESFLQEIQLEQPIESDSINEVPAFSEIIHQEVNDNTKIHLIQEQLSLNYNNSYLDAQPDILASLSQEQDYLEHYGHLFLPKYPSHFTQIGTNAVQLDIPLLLQTHPVWGNYTYGTDGSQKIWENGCAILALAMLESYFSDITIDPADIISWSHNDYYLDHQGTSWQIFHDYAVNFGYQFENLGNHFEGALQAIKNGKVVIVSVKPGLFTAQGHLLILRGVEDSYVFVNDPNDTPEKMFSLRPIDSRILQEEALNYWSFYR